MYLIDTNVLIEARDRYYKFERVPGFWLWLEEEHAAERLYSVTKVRDEICGRKDDLEAWVRKLPEGFFLEPDQQTQAVMSQLSHWATNHENYTALAAQTFMNGADYILAAHASAHQFIVVSQEKPAPNAKTNIKLPDACAAVEVRCLQTFDWLDLRNPRF